MRTDPLRRSIGSR